MILDLGSSGKSPDKKTKPQEDLGEDEEIISTYPGTSQYRQDNKGGVSNSACGLACMNFVRHVISLEASGETEKSILTSLLQREAMEVRKQ